MIGALVAYQGEPIGTDAPSTPQWFDPFLQPGTQSGQDFAPQNPIPEGGNLPPVNGSPWQRPQGGTPTGTEPGPETSQTTQSTGTYWFLWIALAAGILLWLLFRRA